MQSVKLTEKAFKEMPEGLCRPVFLEDDYCLYGYIWGDMAIVPIGDELRFYNKEEYKL